MILIDSAQGFRAYWRVPAPSSSDGALVLVLCASMNSYSNSVNVGTESRGDDKSHGGTIGLPPPGDTASMLMRDDNGKR